MKLSIIIPAYNDLAGVLRALNSLQNTADRSHEYLVQDDYMETQFSLEAFIPPCAASVQRNPQNLGFGGNCNAGAQRASGDILLFLNQDCYAMLGLSDGWDTALLSSFDDPSVGIVGCRLLFPNGAIQHAGIHFDAKCQPTHRFLGYADKDYIKANISEKVPAVTGAALAVRADLFNALNGFDDVTYVGGYFEDIDLCARVVKMGYKVWYQPKTTFIHIVGTSGGNPNFYRNAQAFKTRWVDTGYIEADTSAIREGFW